MSDTKPAFLTDPKILATIVYEVAKGSQINTASMKAGVKTKDVEHWLEKGRAGKEPFNQFSDEVDRALEGYEHWLSGILHAAVDNKAKPDLSTARWLLERRFPKRWRSRDPGEEVIPVKSDGKSYSPDELRNAADILDAASARAKAKIEAERKAQH